MPARPIQIGIMASDQGSFPDLLRLWKAAEAMGLDSGWVEDHFMPPVGDIGHPMLEGWTLLASLGAHMPRLRLGTLTMVNSYRHPAVLANMAAALDVISGGRLELGIGAGWFQPEYDSYGFPFPKASERLGALAEGIQVMKRLWTQERTSFQGKHYALKDAPCEPKPLQRPHPPVWVGGAGEQLTLRIVAEHADGWNAFFMPPDQLRHKLDVLGEHCARAGRDPATVRKSMMLTFLIDEDETTLARKAQAMADRRKVGVEQLRQRVLIGTPAGCVDRLAPLVAMGIEHFILAVPPPMDPRQLELFAAKVAPALRSSAG